MVSASIKTPFARHGSRSAIHRKARRPNGNQISVPENKRSGGLPLSAFSHSLPRQKALNRNNVSSPGNDLRAHV
ncbi:hypothetical protein HYPGJ_30668 [Hyphomicrobium sp. GJ21]|nr:hypothetical protein HYPGJ_30668 [Hyphomicrobium sp. GJ21]